MVRKLMDHPNAFSKPELRPQPQGKPIPIRFEPPKVTYVSNMLYIYINFCNSKKTQTHPSKVKNKNFSLSVSCLTFCVATEYSSHFFKV